MTNIGTLTATVDQLQAEVNHLESTVITLSVACTVLGLVVGAILWITNH